jgi:hypothetical protein
MAAAETPAIWVKKDLLDSFILLTPFAPPILTALSKSVTGPPNSAQKGRVLKKPTFCATLCNGLRFMQTYANANGEGIKYYGLETNRKVLKFHPRVSYFELNTECAALGHINRCEDACLKSH